ncbi:hypothetical protein AYI70_g10285, partial [Smittium culicis]
MVVNSVIYGLFALLSLTKAQDLVNSPCTGDLRVCVDIDGAGRKFNACNGYYYVQSECGEGTFCYTDKPGLIFCGYYNYQNATNSKDPGYVDPASRLKSMATDENQSYGGSLMSTVGYLGAQPTVTYQV